MSEEPKYLIGNREMISRLMGIQVLRLVVKTQLFDGAVVASSLPPYQPHRGLLIVHTSQESSNRDKPDWESKQS